MPCSSSFCSCKISRFNASSSAACPSSLRSSFLKFKHCRLHSFISLSFSCAREVKGETLNPSSERPCFELHASLRETLYLNIMVQPLSRKKPRRLARENAKDTLNMANMRLNSPCIELRLSPTSTREFSPSHKVVRALDSALVIGCRACPSLPISVRQPKYIYKPLDTCWRLCYCCCSCSQRRTLCPDLPSQQWPPAAFLRASLSLVCGSHSQASLCTCRLSD